MRPWEANLQGRPSHASSVLQVRTRVYIDPYPDLRTLVPGRARATPLRSLGHGQPPSGVPGSASLP